MAGLELLLDQDIRDFVLVPILVIMIAVNFMRADLIYLLLGRSRKGDLGKSFNKSSAFPPTPPHRSVTS